MLSFLGDALKSAANCKNAAVYFKSCVCGQISTTEFFVSDQPEGFSQVAEIFLGHSVEQAVEMIHPEQLKKKDADMHPSPLLL